MTRSAYRAGACEFCDHASSSTCPRCLCDVCDDHGKEGQPYCSMCLKEFRDEREIARFKKDVLRPDEAPPAPGLPDDRGAELLIGMLYRWIHGWRQKPDLAHGFEQRTPEEIATWRREAGIRTRSGR